MKKALLAFGMILVTASTASAGGMVTKHASSVQLTVDAARTTATRIGNSYSVSGSGVVTDVGGTGTADLNVGGLGTISNGAAAGSFATTTQATSGDTGAVSAFSNQTSYAAGAAGSLAGTIDNAHTMTLTAGDPGSSATGQFITEVTIID